MAAGTTYFISDRARRLVQASIGSHYDPVFLDTDGKIKQCTQATDTFNYIRVYGGTFETRIQTTDTNGGLYIADPTNISESSIRLLNFNRTSWSYTLGQETVTDSNNGKHNTTIFVYPTLSALNNVFINSGYDLYMYASAGYGVGNSKIYFTQSTGTSAAPTGTGTQYRSINVFPVTLSADLPYFKTPYTDGVAGTEVVGSSNVAFNIELTSVNATTLQSTGFKETYFLMASTNDTANHTYRIHSTKYAITAGQGGTGRTSWTPNRFIYSSAATTLSNSTVGTDGNNLLLNFSSPVDLTAANNGGGQYSRSIRFYDSTGDYQSGLVQSTVNTDGSTEMKLFAGNYVNGAQTFYGITIKMNKDNTLSYTVASGSSLRSAIGAYSTSGGTLTGQIQIKVPADTFFIRCTNTDVNKGTLPSANLTAYGICIYDAAGTVAANRLSMFNTWIGTTGETRSYLYTYGFASGSTTNAYFGLSISYDTTVMRTYTNAQIYGAVWNDYAEFRQTNKQVKPGQCVIDNDDGSVAITNKRLLPGVQIVSDTFGFAIGETDKTKTPLAVSGRVLARTYRDRSEYHAGMAVCSAPNGTVDIMTREEIMMYPDCIVGIVSEIPEYDTWGTGNINVDGRIWIKVK